MENGDKQEILEAIAGLAQHIDSEFAKVRSEMATKEEFRSEIGKLRAEMATKDFVERQILASEDRVLTEVQKVATNQETLVKILERKEVITADESDLVVN